jgi:hypothetical protein
MRFCLRRPHDLLNQLPMARHDAWKFGSVAEHASREGRIAQHFRNLVHLPAQFAPARNPRV